jgi:TRAP-type transport system periplasmic protein
MQINEPAPAEMARMREAVKPVYERSAATIGKETVDRMVASLARIRGTN